MIIGVTGNNGSGKDTFADYLVSNKGFVHISLSDFIREETVRRGMEMTRFNFHDVGNDMRESSGPCVLASLALDKMDKNKDYVITSIRNPNEIRELEKAGNFALAAVDAPVETRFNRIIERNRKNEKEIISFEAFKKFEAEELESQLSSSQQIKECIEMAKFNIDNGCDMEEFSERIGAVYDKIADYLRKKNDKNRSYRRCWGWKDYVDRIFGRPGI
jgi:dephospho-CoA kinase